MAAELACLALMRRRLAVVVAVRRCCCPAVLLVLLILLVERLVELARERWVDQSDAAKVV